MNRQTKWSSMAAAGLAGLLITAVAAPSRGAGGIPQPRPGQMHAG